MIIIMITLIIIIIIIINNNNNYYYYTLYMKINGRKQLCYLGFRLRPHLVSVLTEEKKLILEKKILSFRADQCFLLRWIFASLTPETIPGSH